MCSTRVLGPYYRSGTRDITDNAAIIVFNRYKFFTDIFVRFRAAGARSRSFREKFTMSKLVIVTTVSTFHALEPKISPELSNTRAKGDIAKLKKKFNVHVRTYIGEIYIARLYRSKLRVLAYRIIRRTNPNGNVDNVE